MSLRALTVLMMVVTFAVLAAGQERFVKPVDEASKDASFLAFRTKLIAAAERKDARFIRSILDPDIMNSFGGNGGIKEFEEAWGIDEGNSRFWSEFLPVIKHGGAFSPPTEASGRMFIAPYSFSSWPEELDAFEHHLIFGTDVNLREKPSMDAKVLEKLSYNVVKITGAEPAASENEPSKEPDWYRIETLGGKKGWVKAEFVRSPIDYRAGFEKKKGVWKMTFFIAGD